MKTIHLIWLLTLMPILFCRCSEGNDAPPYIYLLKIKFEDRSGKNLINGIKHSDATDGTFLRVTDVYKLQVSSSSLPAQDESLFITFDNQEKYLYFSYTTFDDVASTITWKLTCPHIFGNDKEHKIISHWEKTSKYQAVCSKIIFDEKECQVTKNENAPEYTVRITLP